ncbi:MAG: glycosyltransferase [Nitrososphaerales archaeon]
MQLKAAVIHHNLNSRGGGERVAVNTIELLKDMGFTVELVTSQKPEFEAIEKAYGRKIEVDRVIALFPFKFKYFGIYQRLFTIIPALRVRDADIVINTHGDVLPYYLPAGVPYIAYLHFPVLALMLKEYPSKYQNSLFWKAYFKPYKYLTETLMDYGMKRGTILTNSNFSKEAIKKIYPDIEPIIIYPPVDVERFSQVLNSNNRVDKILVVSRYTPEKKLENTIKIIKMLPRNIKLQIIGSLIPANYPYYQKLLKIANEEEVRGRVSMLINASFETLLGAMATSKAYLHTMVGEHFGISIVEAMAAGLIPVVPNHGGQTEFVPSIYHYRNLEHASQIILQVMNSNQYERNALNKIANKFSESTFKESMKKLITDVLYGVKSNKVD